MKFNFNSGSHAPGCLRDALIEALESTWEDDHQWWELVHVSFLDPVTQLAWEDADELPRAIWLLAQLSNCTDIVPEDICSAVDVPRGCTYATLARALRAELNGDKSDSSKSGPMRLRPNGDK